MDFLISTNLALLLAAIAINSGLAFWVFRNNPKSATNIFFVLLSLVISFWLLANYVSLKPTFSSPSLFWIRLTIFLATPMTSLFFLLAHTLPSSTIRLKKRVLVALLFTTFIVMALSVSPYAFTDLDPSSESPSPLVGLGIIPFGIFSSAMVLAAAIALRRKWKKARGVQRQQFIFILLGITLMSGAIIFTIFIPVVLFGFNGFVDFMPIYTLFFLGATAYAILRHNLFNIRLIATELFATLVIFIFLINFILSSGVRDAALNGALFALTTLFGVLLVRGTLREIRALQELSDAKTEFVNIASHQLRTPLSIAKGYLSMLNEGSYGELSPKQLKISRILYVANERMLNLVADLLNVSRAEQGKLQYQFEKIDIRDIIDTVVENLSIIAREKNLTLVWQKPPEPTFIRADKDKIRNVLMNLVDNAIKYTAQGGITVSISRESAPPGSLAISIKDTGIGLTQDEIVKLFEQFRRGDRGRRVNASGSGLGLYIAKRIAEDHKGRVRVESEGENKGSTFIIELPLFVEKQIKNEEQEKHEE